MTDKREALLAEIRKEYRIVTNGVWYKIQRYCPDSYGPKWQDAEGSAMGSARYYASETQAKNELYDVLLLHAKYTGDWEVIDENTN
jgi:hypothetical protein